MKNAVAVLLAVVLLTAPAVIAVKPVWASPQKWTQTYGSPDNDFAYSLAATSDGGYALLGSTGSPVNYTRGYVGLVKTDAEGNELWNRTYGIIGKTQGYYVVQTVDGGYAIAGSNTSASDNSDAWLVKTDADGILQWAQTYGGPDMDMALSVVATSDGGYALLGITPIDDGFGGRDAWLIKTDSYGDELWNRTYGGSGSDTGLSLVQTSDGGYAIAGSTDSYGAEKDDFWLVKTDADGNEMWTQTYGGPESDGAYALVQASDGGYALAGSTYSFGAGGQDFWLVKTDEYGVVPEAAWVVMPLLLVATLAIFISKKKKLLHQQSRVS